MNGITITNFDFTSSLRSQLHYDHNFYIDEVFNFNLLSRFVCDRDWFAIMIFLSEELNLGLMKYGFQPLIH